MATRAFGLLRQSAALARAQPLPRLARSASTAASGTGFEVSQAGEAKLKVAAADDQSPTAAITVVLKAGSRYESVPGLAHVLKNSLLKSTSKRSELRIVREAEILGGVLTTGLTREHLFITAEFLRGEEGFFAEVLGDALPKARFVKHEFTEAAVPQSAAEYAQAIQDPLVFALDVAHQLAFRTGLGNSLFASPHSAVEWSQLVSSAQRAFTDTSNIAVLGSGISARTLTGLVNEFFTADPNSDLAQAAAQAAGGLASSGSPSTSAKSGYFGGEVRAPATGHHHHKDHLLVGFKGGAVSQPAYAVLAQYLGGVPSVKWTKGSTPFSALQTSQAHIRAFNVPYSDAGLIGFQVSGETAALQGVASKAVEELKKVASGVKDEDVKRAIAKAKFAIANVTESRTGKLELAGSQLLANGSIPSLEQASAELDKITASDVKKAAEEALKSKATTVAIGNTHQLPWADSLGLPSA